MDQKKRTALSTAVEKPGQALNLHRPKFTKKLPADDDGDFNDAANKKVKFDNNLAEEETDLKEDSEFNKFEFNSNALFEDFDDDGDDDEEDEEEDEEMMEDEESSSEEDSDEESTENEQNSDEEELTVTGQGNSRGSDRPTADEYEHDSSDEEDVLNTIGNIPYHWYKDYVHIGYDVHGRKIIKPPKEDEIDEFLRKMDDPTYWRTVQDKLTGQKVVLSDQDVDLIQRIRNAKCPDPSYDPYAPFIDFFTYEKMIHPVHNMPETKASFIPSLAEKRIVSKLVTAIKRARLKPKPKPKKDSQFNFSYDLWENENEKSKRNERYIPAPKPKPPGHEESYNPPPEYLFTEEEKKEWLEQEPEERRTGFIPRSFSSLRQVPTYPDFIKERFERCLDLYLCPRVRKNRVHIDPEDLIPQLPRPADLQPFPAIHSMVYLGHQGKVLSVSVEPNGQFFVSGDDTGLVKIFEVLTGRCFKTIELPGAVTSVSWYPNASRSIITAVVEKDVYLINSALGHKQTTIQTDEYFANSASEMAENGSTSQSEETSVEWHSVDAKSDAAKWNQGVRLVISHKFEVSQLTWHNGGEYFATVMPTGANKSVIIHHLSKRKSQVPFKKSKDIIKCVQFHPTRAYFFVATKKSVRVYNLIKQELSKKLMVNTSEVSCMAIHPGGDNVLIGGVDPKVQWFDMDLSTRAYKTLRYHTKSVRAVQFHGKYPLFASASDDGTVVVCHGMVYDDLLQNALIVPVKVLKAPKDSSAMLNCTFHTVQPWLFACSTNSIRLFT